MNQSGRQEKVREALDAAYVKDYWEAALAEVEEWETRLADAERSLNSMDTSAVNLAQQQLARAEAAEAALTDMHHRETDLTFALAAAEAEADRLKAALAFYADPASWEESGEPDPRYFATGIIAVNDDEGAIARAALEINRDTGNAECAPEQGKGVRKGDDQIRTGVPAHKADCLTNNRVARNA